MADSSKPTRTARETGRARSTLWGAPFVLGMAITLLGVLAFIAARITSLATILVFGALLAIGGIVEIVEGFWHRKTGHLVLHVLSGVLAAVVGGILLFRPVAGLTAVGLLLGGFFLASGLFRGITAVADRYERWGFDLAYGLLAIGLGIVVFAGWPLTSLWLVGALVGAELVIRGVAIMGVALTVRRELGKTAV
ncbi:MAG: HdeD family acid-resistance protein [Myxococcales bacterium]|jgi:uncharacterized membrane protein HdeD (DUF308 family)